LAGRNATADADSAEEITWTSFRTRFLEKYFPDSAKHEREVEFLTFQQGNQTVLAYTDRFEYLAIFYSPVVTEEWRCRKYEGGLKHELCHFIVPPRIREFPVLVEQAKAVERLEMRPSKVVRSQKTTIDTRQQKKPYNRPPSSSRKLQCFNCGGEHLRRDYPKPSCSSGGGPNIGK